MVLLHAVIMNLTGWGVIYSVHSQFLPAEDITPAVMSSSSAREEINTRRVMHVANITDRTSERNALRFNVSDRAMQDDIWAQLRVRAVKGMRSLQRHLRKSNRVTFARMQRGYERPVSVGVLFSRLRAVFFRLWPAGR
jgi:hypothetical protein